MLRCHRRDPRAAPPGDPLENTTSPLVHECAAYDCAVMSGQRLIGVFMAHEPAYASPAGITTCFSRMFLEEATDNVDRLHPDLRPGARSEGLTCNYNDKTSGSVRRVCVSID